MFIRCDINPTFTSSEDYIPKYAIQKDINTLKNIRLIQFLNWPIIKRKLLEKYPMIDKVSLSIRDFPNIAIGITEKTPWVIIIKNNTPLIFSYDGILLNENLTDVELPNKKITVVNASIPIANKNKIIPTYLDILHQIADGIKLLPVFKLQQIVIKKDTIEIVEDNGLVIHLGNEKKIKEKFTMLKYFLGSKRGGLNHGQLIDIQFPKRVIIK